MSRRREKLTDAERERQTFETNSVEDVIAVDHSNDPGLLETFAAFQTKLSVMSQAASRIIALEQRQAEATGRNDGTSAEDRAVAAAGAIAAAKEECRTVVLETQELAKKLTKPELKRMAHTLAEKADALMSTTGLPLSMFDEDSWPTCFVEFFYGDAVPNMTERGKKGNGTGCVPMQDLRGCRTLNKLEYHLPSDAERYKARPTSRFDTSECTAIFGSVLRPRAALAMCGHSVSQAKATRRT